MSAHIVIGEPDVSSFRRRCRPLPRLRDAGLTGSGSGVVALRREFQDVVVGDLLGLDS